LRHSTIAEFGLRKMKFPTHRVNHVSNNIKLAKHFKEIKQVEREFRESTLNKVNRQNLEHIKIEKNKRQIEKRSSYLSQSQKWSEFRKKKDGFVDQYIKLKRV
jgi:hypothetical protein